MKKKTNEKKNKWRGLPWWLHLIFAIASYSLLKYGVAEINAAGPGRPALALLAEQAAPIVAVIFLLLSANALYRKDTPKDDEKPDDDLSEDQ